MGQVGEGPGEVVVDQVHPGGQLPKAQGRVGRELYARDPEPHRRLVDHMAVESLRGRLRFIGRRQDMAAHAKRTRGDAQLVDELLDASEGVRAGEAEVVEDAHASRGSTCTRPSRAARATT